MAETGYLPFGKSSNSGYGLRIHPIFKTIKFHAGLDFSAPSGTLIPAAAAGTVVFAGWNDGFGWTVITVGADGVGRLYAHMGQNAKIRPALPALGSTIELGDIVGPVGNTGSFSDGSHLHYSLISKSAMGKLPVVGSGALGFDVNEANTLDPRIASLGGSLETKFINPKLGSPLVSNSAGLALLFGSQTLYELGYDGKSIMIRQNFGSDDEISLSRTLDSNLQTTSVEITFRGGNWIFKNPQQVKTLDEGRTIYIKGEKGDVFYLRDTSISLPVFGTVSKSFELAYSGTELSDGFFSGWQKKLIGSDLISAAETTTLGPSANLILQQDNTLLISGSRGTSDQSVVGAVNPALSLLWTNKPIPASKDISVVNFIDSQTSVDSTPSPSVLINTQPNITRAGGNPRPNSTSGPSGTLTMESGDMPAFLAAWAFGENSNLNSLREVANKSQTVGIYQTNANTLKDLNYLIDQDLGLVDGNWTGKKVPGTDIQLNSVNDILGNKQVQDGLALEQMNRAWRYANSANDPNLVLQNGTFARSAMAALIGQPIPGDPAGRLWTMSDILAMSTFGSGNARKVLDGDQTVTDKDGKNGTKVIDRAMRMHDFDFGEKSANGVFVTRGVVPPDELPTLLLPNGSSFVFQFLGGGKLTLDRANIEFQQIDRKQGTVLVQAWENGELYETQYDRQGNQVARVLVGEEIGGVRFRNRDSTFEQYGVSVEFKAGEGYVDSKTGLVLFDISDISIRQQTDVVTTDDFRKLEIRLGNIWEAQAVLDPNASTNSALSQGISALSASWSVLKPEWIDQLMNTSWATDLLPFSAKTGSTGEAQICSISEIIANIQATGGHVDFADESHIVLALHDGNGIATIDKYGISVDGNTASSGIRWSTDNQLDFYNTRWGGSATIQQFGGNFDISASGFTGGQIAELLAVNQTAAIDSYPLDAHADSEWGVHSTTLARTGVSTFKITTIMDGQPSVLLASLDRSALSGFPGSGTLTDTDIASPELTGLVAPQQDGLPNPEDQLLAKSLNSVRFDPVTTTRALPGLSSRQKQDSAFVAALGGFNDVFHGTGWKPYYGGYKVINNITAIGNNGNPLPVFVDADTLIGPFAQLGYLGLGLKGSSSSKVSAVGSSTSYVINNFMKDQLLDKTSFAFAANNFLNGTAGADGQLGLLSGGTPGALSVVCLVNSLSNGDGVGIAQGVTHLLLPPTDPVSIAVDVIALVYSLFQTAPKAWGNATVNYGEGLNAVVSAVGDSFGTARAQGTLQSIVNALQDAITEQNSINPADPFGIIPQRISTLSWRASDLANPGYAITDIDPLTGAQTHADVRWDDDGIPVHPDVSDPYQMQRLSSALWQSAIAREAVAPIWEVQTAKMQQAAGDPNAGLSEQERASKAGITPAVDAVTNQATPGVFRPIALDLNGNGQIDVTARADSTAYYAWDSRANTSIGVQQVNNFRKHVAWVDGSSAGSVQESGAKNFDGTDAATAGDGTGDALLWLDRNPNGRTDDGRELFSNVQVGDAAKGVRSLAAYDANFDGVITAADPVFNQLKVWRDLNNDGQLQEGEAKPLAELGITQLDGANNTFTQNGQTRYLGSPTLDADESGLRQTTYAKGVKLETVDENGNYSIRMIVTRVSHFDADNDHVLNYEDGDGSARNPLHGDGYAPMQMSIQNDLLINDKVNGTNADLTITGFNNVRHGTLARDVSDPDLLYFVPDANYNSGIAYADTDPNNPANAGFDYVVTTPNGTSKTAHVSINLEPVDDVPIITVTYDRVPVYGYGVLARGSTVTSADGSYWDVTSVQRNQGVVITSPYETVLGRIKTVTFVPTGGLNAESNPAGRSITTYSANQDTLIPRSYVEKYLADRHIDPHVVFHDESGNAFDYSTLTFSMDGQTIEVNVASPQYVAHNEPLLKADGSVVTEVTNTGKIAVIDPDSASSTLTVSQQPTFGRVDNAPTGAATLGADGYWYYLGERYVDQRVDGSQAQFNVFDNTHTRSEASNPATSFADPFVVHVSDGLGGESNVTVLPTHFGPTRNPNIAASGGKKPIAVDMAGTGFHFTDVDDSNVFFDVNGDGWKRKISWVAPGTGLLAFDKNGDGQIDQYDEISFVPYKPDGQTDLDGLRAFDSNANGKLDAGDSRWAQFGVWQDTNANGITDAGEWKALGALGINTIALQGNGQFQVIDGQTVHGSAVATTTDGSILAIADVTLKYKDLTQITRADGSVSTVSVPKVSAGQELTGTADKDLAFGTSASDKFVMGDGNDVVVDDGGDDAVQAGAGDDLVYTGRGNDVADAGTGNDSVFAGPGNDLVFGNDGDDLIMLDAGNDIGFGGNGNDFIAGGQGNDVISGNAGDDKLAGEAGWDVLFGDDGNDELFGMDGNDMLYGGAGDDLLDGGAGADTMEGGSGNDTYGVDSTTDTISEDSSGTDAGGIDTVRASISYTLANRLENLTLLDVDSGDDNLTGAGNGADNLLIGNSGSNVLTGGAGNDTLDGGLGSDILRGGTGDDTYVVDNAGDVVIEMPSEGTDTVRSRISYALAVNVENLVLVGVNPINGTGNALANILTGNAGANRLDGAAGADTMRGGRGNDTYVIDNTGDMVVELFGEGLDTIESSVSYTLAANVENLTLTGTALSGVGNELANVIQGNSQRNLLDGGLGADDLRGGLGDDTYMVDDQGDSVTEAAEEGTDSVQASVSYALTDNVESLTLTGASAINGTGNGLGNLLFGNEAANRLDGAGGADTMRGGAGDDVYGVDNPGDTVLELARDGYDTVESSISYTLAAEVEALLLTGSDDLAGAGNALDNLLTGNAGNNVLDGGAGIDTLRGGFGDDRYIVDNTADTVVEALESGTDTVFSRVSYTLAANVENLTLLDLFAIDGTGNALDNTLTGNSGNNRLDGGMGADAMRGGAGNDTYVVDNISDVVEEQSGYGTDAVESSISYALGDNLENLTLTGTSAINGMGNSLGNLVNGNQATNRLDGGSGADTLRGGGGDDVYIVDNAGDSVLELAGGGSDTVESSVSYMLAAEVENLILTGTGDLAGTGNTLDNLLIGNTGNNVLDGGAGADTLRGGLGDDTYIIDNVGCVIVEAFGEGTDTVLSRISYTLTQNVENLMLLETGPADGTGNTLDNTLIGNAHDNRLDGGLGADVMRGGAGDDTYVVDNFADIVEEQSGNGMDTVESSINFTLGSNVENLVLKGTANLNASGNSAANLMVGNGGINVLAGGAGNDTYIVQNLADTVMEMADEGTDLVISIVSYELGAHVENLTLTGFAPIDGKGNVLDNRLTGNSSANILDGGHGSDYMQGGAGNDTYFVDNAGDAVFEEFDAGTDTVVASIDYALGSNVENLLLAGSARSGTGNSLNNAITGGWRDDFLNGLDGNDVLQGGAGDDRLLGGYGDDVLDGGEGSDELAGGGGNNTYVFGRGDGQDLLGCVGRYEYAETYGVHTDTLRFRDGVTQDDVVLKRLGESSEIEVSIRGTQDKLQVELFIYGDDTGNRYNPLQRIEFADGSVWGLAEMVVRLNTGTPGDDHLRATIGADVLIGGAGNDYLNGLDGNDVLQGGAGDDRLLGGYGDDVLDGGEGSDELAGGGGNNTYLFGRGDGQDLLAYIGRYGYDEGYGAHFNTLRFKDGVTPDDVVLKRLAVDTDIEVSIKGTQDKVQVATFFAGDDPVNRYNPLQRIEFADGTVWALAEMVVRLNTGTPGDDHLRATIGADVLIGGTGNDYLNGLDGNDVLQGGAGGDRLLGGYGDDVLDGGEGSDELAGGGGNNTYLFGRGDGQDLLAYNGRYDYDEVYVAHFNTLSFRAGVTPEDVVLKRLDEATDIEVSIKGTQDKVRVATFYVGDDPVNRYNPLQRIQFENGTVWGLTDLVGRLNNRAPVVSTPLADQSVKSGTSWQLDGAASFVDADSGDLLTFSSTRADGSALPAWLKIDSRTGILSGTPDEMGTLSIRINATDRFGSSIGDDFNLTVEPTRNAPVLTGSVASQTILSGQAFVLTLPVGLFTDPDPGDVLKLTLSDAKGLALPSWLQFNPGSRMLTGTPTWQQAGSNDLTVIATDLTGMSAQTGFSLTVQEVPTHVGTDAADVLVGSTSADLIDGRAGADRMTGGKGDDTYLVDNTADVVVEKANDGTDSVRATVTYALAANVECLILAGTADIDGNGNTLDNTITGNTGSNKLYGNAGADALYGGAGDDWLRGGSDNDLLVGGLGDDLYEVDSAGDVVLEANDEGNDTVESSVTYSLGANIENLILTGISAIDAFGNALDNLLQGNDSDNAINGEAGDDVLNGRKGMDTLTGGRGNDTYLFEDDFDVVIEKPNEGRDLIVSQISFTLAANVEDGMLVASAVSMTGNELANVLTGNNAANILDGAAGADVLAGGKGNDTYYVDNEADTVVEDAAEGMDLIYASVNYALAENTENLVLTGTAEAGMGNDLANKLTGNERSNKLWGGAGNDTLDGGAGADVLIGGLGNDAYYVDTKDDIVYEAFAEGTDKVFASVSYVLADNVENLTLTGSDNINAVGNALNNTLEGNSGNNVLFGGLGNDTYVFGRGSGQDTIVNFDAGKPSSDRIQLGANIAATDISLARRQDDLILRINGSSDQLTVLKYFESAGKGNNALEKIRFADGTSWNYAAVNSAAVNESGASDAQGLPGSVKAGDPSTLYSPTSPAASQTSDTAAGSSPQSVADSIASARARFEQGLQNLRFNVDTQGSMTRNEFEQRRAVALLWNIQDSVLGLQLAKNADGRFTGDVSIDTRSTRDLAAASSFLAGMRGSGGRLDQVARVENVQQFDLAQL